MILAYISFGSAVMYVLMDVYRRMYPDVITDKYMIWLNILPMISLSLGVFALWKGRYKP